MYKFIHCKSICLSITLHISLNTKVVIVSGDVRVCIMQRDLHTLQERKIIIWVSLWSHGPNYYDLCKFLLTTNMKSYLFPFCLIGHLWWPILGRVCYKSNACRATCSLKKIYNILKIQVSKKITVWCNFFWSQPEQKCWACVWRGAYRKSKWKEELAKHEQKGQ